MSLYTTQYSRWDFPEYPFLFKEPSEAACWAISRFKQEGFQERMELPPPRCRLCCSALAKLRRCPHLVTLSSCHHRRGQLGLPPPCCCRHRAAAKLPRHATAAAAVKPPQSYCCHRHQPLPWPLPTPPLSCRRHSVALLPQQLPPPLPPPPPPPSLPHYCYRCRCRTAAKLLPPITTPSYRCSAATAATATANPTTKLPQSGCCAAATAATAVLPLPPLRCCQDAAATTITTAPSRRRSTDATKLPRCDATAVVADCRPATRGGGAQYCRLRRWVEGAWPRTARASFPPQ